MLLYETAPVSRFLTSLSMFTPGMPVMLAPLAYGAAPPMTPPADVLLMASEKGKKLICVAVGICLAVAEPGNVT